MKPFEKAEYPDEAFNVERYIKLHGCTREQAEQAVADLRVDQVFINDHYQVAIRVAETPPGIPKMWWLSIKRRDKRVIRDWRVLQDIKNTLIGPDHEGMELFPAESRLVDTANQYHLFVFQHPAHRFPFGFTTRLVADSKTAAHVGAKQRDRKKETRGEMVERLYFEEDRK